jgi:pimeloyl-ACP methyl ester carboxylesterase/DNA-binding winged helix-turn-helix (wHTH) protein
MEQVLGFSRYRFELETGRLWSGKREIKLTPKASAVLKELVMRAGKPVTKEELFASVWKDAVVSDDALTSCVQELRRALADNVKRPRFIETRYRRGYRFVARLFQATAEDGADSPLPTSDMRPRLHYAESGALNFACQATGILYARSGGVNIAYQVVGAGPIDLVVAPGYMSHLEQDWRWPDNARFIRRLASFARVILFDRRGTGLSDRFVPTCRFDEVMDDIAAVMDAAGSTRAALLGGAEGGPMCILFAAAFPKRTHALVLVASYARRMWAPDYPWGLREATHRRILATYEKRWGREPVGVDLVAPTLANVPGFAAWYTAAQRHGGSPGAALAWYRVTTEIDVRHVLPAVRVPTLVIHRTGDRVQPVESGRYLAEQIPGARYVELPGDDHFWFAGDADKILDEIEEFLTGTRQGPDPDRVLATVLFTDIVGSTERAATLGIEPGASC